MRGSVCQAARIAYAALRDETLRVGGVLRELKMKRGDRVALLLADSPEFIASFVAIISSGAIAVPIQPRVTSGATTLHSQRLWPRQSQSWKTQSRLRCLQAPRTDKSEAPDCRFPRRHR
jgi:acyl-CoA synthetase (AMP-forming)/AMP-acid ligase II